MKFKVGDKVKLVSMNYEKEYYKKYLGKIYTIARIGIDVNGEFADLKETDSISPFLKNLKLVEEYTYEDLKKSPIGTKITFENGEVLVKDDKETYENENKYRDEKYFSRMEDKIGTLGKIIKIEEPTYQTVFETKADILDETEKRYLSNIIKPFKKVKSIRKYIFSDKKQACIVINVFNLDESYWTISLPPFKKDTMYKEMEDNKEYTLEELGL